MSEDERRTTKILAVSVDTKPELQRMVDRVGKEYGTVPDFPLLSDPGHRVIDRYGLFNPEDRRNIPHPATYVIDRQGVVRWKFVEVNYKVRPSNEVILEALRAMKESVSVPVPPRSSPKSSTTASATKSPTSS